jgi:asparagine synthase (glutamine-hydrolysing)
VHLFAVAVGLPEVSAASIGRELDSLGCEFGLDPGTAWSVTSREGLVRAAGIHHALARSRPRSYADRSASHVTWFDGLPVSRQAGLVGSDAGELARSWPSLDSRLDGQFCAVQVDLDAQTVEVLLDTLGFVPVYAAQRGNGVLLSNSAGLISSLLDLGSPDPLGVSSFMGLGWAAADRTLTQGVRWLCGGARHRVANGTITTAAHFGPAQIARPEQRAAALGVEELAQEMVALTARAVAGIERVGCALTGGRDSRVALAVLRAAGEDPLYFTGGPEDIPDVVIARELAAWLGLRHEVVNHDPAAVERDWTEAAVRFMRQNDGLSSLIQIGDYIDLSSAGPPIGVKLGGMGGEIGRAGTGDLTAVATNVPLLRRSIRAQHALLALKARDESGLLTGEASEEVARYLRAFYRDRLDEGWRPMELQESFYIFQRIGRWAPTGTRRVAGTDDGFNPLCARAFLDYCLALTPAERYLEAAHYRLLGELDPALREHRFENALRPQRRLIAPLHATSRLARAAGERLAGLLPRRSSVESEERVRPEYPFPHAWLEGRLELISELFDQPSSELWNMISRPRVEALMRGSEADRARLQAPLLRAATVFWHFHGERLKSHAPQSSGREGLAAPTAR